MVDTPVDHGPVIPPRQQPFVDPVEPPLAQRDGDLHDADDPVIVEEKNKPAGRVAVGGAISHPSVAAIVSADPGGRADPAVPTMMVHAKNHFSDTQLAPIQFKAREAAIPPIPKIANPHADQSVKTSAQEQTERSEQNERDGMPNWPMNNDDLRRPNAPLSDYQRIQAGQNPGQVKGVGFNPVPEGSS